MMTLESAIKHCEEVAEAEEQKYKKWKGDYPHLKKIDSCIECAKEHRRLAEWLKQLKKLKEKAEPKSVLYVKDGLADDDYIAYCPNCDELLNDYWYRGYCPCCGQALEW